MLSRWSFIAVAVLLVLPVVLMAGVGTWAIFQAGHWIWLCWTIPVCWTAAWCVNYFSRGVAIPVPEIGSRLHWTPRDHEAMAIVEAEQKRVTQYTGEQLTDPQFYTERSIELASAFAKHYHPHSTDPLGSLSIVELLTAVHLVAEDLEVMLRENVPGSHLITVSQWRMLAKAPDWYNAASNLTWLASILINPVSLSRYALSKAFGGPLSKHLQTNLLATSYAIFVRQLGFYLIELNSGRLRGGAAPYRATMRKMESSHPGDSSATTTAAEPAEEPVTVTIAIIGQVKAGKSSLVNCLIGEQRAAVDILPLTNSVKRYELQIEDQPNRLVLLDTPGYNDSGATAEQMKETREAARNADIILLVLDARSPAKQVDVKTLDDLREWFRKERHLKPPPTIGVVSKIDGLSPLMEWAPPYSFERPQRPKEQNIRAAVQFVKETFGDRLASVVPVCTDAEHKHVFGVEEYLMPTLMLSLDEARAVSLVRSLHRDYDQQRGWQVFSQLFSAGSKIRDLAPEFFNKDQLQQAAKSILTSVLKK